MTRLYILLGRVLYVVLLPLIRLRIKRTNRVYVALIYDGKVVLVKNWLARDTWRLPGGGQGKLEDAKVAVVREINEELGLDIDKVGLIELGSGVMGTDRLGFNYTNFAYKLPYAPAATVDHVEVVDYGVFDIPPYQTQPEVVALFAKLKKQRLL